MKRSFDGDKKQDIHDIAKAESFEKECSEVASSSCSTTAEELLNWQYHLPRQAMAWLAEHGLAEEVSQSLEERFGQ